jgi:nicotinate-nucleotide adenylyltransferase
MAGPEIALLGGSFNPPHVAHLMAAYWVLVTQGVSEVWLLPAFQHPFGKELAPFDDRMRMCELAAAPLRGVAVCGAEAELAGDPLVGKTARLLEHLTDKHPDRRFAWIIGGDVAAQTKSWYRFDRVQELARIIVVGRQGFQGLQGLQGLEGLEGLEDAPALPRISSSEIRERLAQGRDVSRLVPARVQHYIEERGLYRP